MKEIFVKNENPYYLRKNDRHVNDLVNPSYNAFTYGECSLRTLGPKMWNALPTEFKDCKPLLAFKMFLKLGMVLDVHAKCARPYNR